MNEFYNQKLSPFALLVNCQKEDEINIKLILEIFGWYVESLEKRYFYENKTPDLAFIGLRNLDHFNSFANRFLGVPIVFVAIPSLFGDVAKLSKNNMLLSSPVQVSHVEMILQLLNS